MQVVLADWRFSVERKSERKPVSNGTVEAVSERNVRQSRVHQQIENERRAVQNQMLMHGLKTQI